ncbi:RNA-binding protein [Bradyrhizobium sp. STM 3566]|uniref:RNA-binding protein n=1 Tax=Bradyrhizobium sp. STM 3566 TaxID=578928 RepID=UPI00388D45CF
MNFREPAVIHHQQPASESEAVGQIEIQENVTDTPEAGSSLFAICGIGVAGLVMLGWICALAWIAWRIVGWMLS